MVQDAKSRVILSSVTPHARILPGRITACSRPCLIRFPTVRVVAARRSAVFFIEIIRVVDSAIFAFIFISFSFDFLGRNCRTPCPCNSRSNLSLPRMGRRIHEQSRIFFKYLINATISGNTKGTGIVRCPLCERVKSSSVLRPRRCQLKIVPMLRAIGPGWECAPKLYGLFFRRQPLVMLGQDIRLSTVPHHRL